MPNCFLRGLLRRRGFSATEEETKTRREAIRLGYSSSEKSRSCRFQTRASQVARQPVEIVGTAEVAEYRGEDPRGDEGGDGEGEATIASAVFARVVAFIFSN